MPEESTHTGSLYKSHGLFRQIGHTVKPKREQFNPTVSSLGIQIHLPTSLLVGESLDKEIGEGVGEFP